MSNPNGTMAKATAIAMSCMLAGCAGTETLVDSPKVSLSSVQLESASFSRQTFLLGFDVSNPNPFPLPVRAFNYQVSLGQQKFASGEAEGRFTVPARGADAFTISVDLDILNSAAQIASLVQNGVPEDVAYALEGSLAVDIPFTRPIPFSSNGVIRVQGGRF